MSVRKELNFTQVLILEYPKYSYKECTEPRTTVLRYAMELSFDIHL
jgi:hypothetical protein